MLQRLLLSLCSCDVLLNSVAHMHKLLVLDDGCITRRVCIFTSRSRMKIVQLQAQVKNETDHMSGTMLCLFGYEEKVERQKDWAGLKASEVLGRA